MPTRGGGTTRAEEYYATIRKLDNKDWNQFARLKLGLAPSDIDDIKYNYQLDIGEQKYQMLLKWEQRKGFNATIENLQSMVNDFCGTSQQTVASEQDGRSGAVPTNPLPTSPDSSVQPRENIRYKQLILKISRGLTNEDVQDLASFYRCSDRTFHRGSELLFYLDEHNLWGSSDKFSVLRGNMEVIGRQDLCREIDTYRHSFDPDRADAEMMQEISSERTESQESFNEPSSEQLVQSGIYVAGAEGEGIVQQLQKLRNLKSGSMCTEQPLTPSSHDQASQQTQQPSAGSVLRSGGQVFNIENMTIVTSGPAIGNIETNPKETFSLKQGNGGDTVDSDLENICNFEGSLKDFKVLPAPNESYKKHKTNIDRVYPVKHDTKGHVLILSNIDFSSSWGSEYNRVGGEFDCSLMESLFEQLGFIVHVERDKTAERMDDIVVEFAGQDFHKEADMCIIIVMSHGGLVNEKDVIYGVDGNYLPAEHVVRYFDNDQCGNLRGKPKLFFFQFCRGREVDMGVEYDLPDKAFSPEESLNRLLPKHDSTDATKSIRTPTRQDVLIAFATQQGNLSFRSWFTNAIANVFSKKAKSDHVCDMLKEVKRGLSKRVANTDHPATNQGKVMADVRDILLKNIYFFPGHP
ncbi:uncharacterized protein LOC143448264 isoform X1 [Clavelina lepadiformis]|uniref:uncharacterized protein LOC143448264 isoform X1 n=1 Tax=Clavelina lepadiformis TaxID=159417 RepID=UPI0040433FAA